MQRDMRKRRSRVSRPQARRQRYRRSLRLLSHSLNRQLPMEGRSVTSCVAWD